MENASPDPPFETTYANLLSTYNDNFQQEDKAEGKELPLIDLEKLNMGEEAREACKEEIAKACREWGFFQVINHGIPGEVLERMREEQKKLLRMPFGIKIDNRLQELKLSEGSYRWGTRTARRLDQLSWMEVFHVHLADILGGASDFDCCSSTNTNTLRSTVEKFGISVHQLALNVSRILAHQLIRSRSDNNNNNNKLEEEEEKYFAESCQPSSCFLRLSRYPPCPNYPSLYGIVAHTDSDFLTVLHQDDVAGLQILKDNRWITVKPIPYALIINIGDLFQAWSNDVYKSAEHRVVTNVEMERFSTAYFLCPSYDTVITSDVYTNFTFGEFRQQVTQAVTNSGNKIGLPMFLRHKEYHHYHHP